MKYVDLMEGLSIPLMYFTFWFSIIGIILIGIHDLGVAINVFYKIIGALVIAYLIYAILIIFLYFYGIYAIKKGEN